MPGNFSILSNVTNLATLTQTMNNASGYLLGNCFVLISFIVTYAVASKYGSERALTVSSFITCIMAILLRLMSMIPDQTLIITIILAAILTTVNIMQNIE